MIRSLEQAKIDLQTYAGRFHRVVATALIEFVAEYAAKRKDLSPRSERSIIHDLMVKHATREFSNEAGFAIYTKNNLFLLGARGRYTLKLKKLDSRLRTANHVTQLVLDFLGQQLEIPGAENPTCLHLGYRLNRIELTKSEIYITCPSERAIAWEWELGAEGSAGQQNVMPFAPKPPVVRRRSGAGAEHQRAADAARKPKKND